MNTVLRQAVSTLLLLGIVNFAANAQEVSIEHSNPRAAAALYIKMKDAPQQRVVLNSRSLRPGLTRSNTGELLPGAMADTLARALGGRVAEFDSVQRCLPNSYSCRYEGADAIITVGDAQITGDSAAVFVRIQIDTNPGRTKGQLSREYEVFLRRTAAGWSAHYARVTMLAR